MKDILNLVIMQSANQQELFQKRIQGDIVPSIGFGTYELDSSTCHTSVLKALEIGYRHVDTARMYKNEGAVGKAITESSIDRKDIFLTSKVWHEDLSPGTIEKELTESLKLLQTDYLDLFLIHWPNPEFSLEETIHALERERARGRIRHVGVSNFPPSWLKRAIACGPIFCNQIEYHPLLGQEVLLKIALAHDILTTAYSPLAQSEALGLDELKPVADKHGKNTAQVALRWLIEQSHVAAIPRSSSPEHIKSNFDIFDFQLDSEDWEVIEGLPKDKRQINPDFAPDWEV